MVEFIRPLGILEGIDSVVYVPNYNKNPKRQRYNSANLLAKQIGEIINRPVLKNGIIKVFETQRQHDLDYANRLTNLIGAFKCPNSQGIKDKNILLIDDVFTTGTTANLSAKALLECGAENVVCLTAAITNFRKYS